MQPMLRSMLHVEQRLQPEVVTHWCCLASAMAALQMWLYTAASALGIAAVAAAAAGLSSAEPTAAAAAAAGRLLARLG
jgi:hypothetical protein